MYENTHTVLYTSFYVPCNNKNTIVFYTSLNLQILLSWPICIVPNKYVTLRPVGKYSSYCWDLHDYTFLEMRYNNIFSSVLVLYTR